MNLELLYHLSQALPPSLFCAFVCALRPPPVVVIQSEPDRWIVKAEPLVLVSAGQEWVTRGEARAALSEKGT